MADTAVLLEIITYIFQRTPPTADCDEPLSDQTVIMYTDKSCKEQLKTNASHSFLSHRILIETTLIERPLYLLQ